MNASADTLLSIEKYTALAEAKALHGSMDLKDWENARSYAVEALTGLLTDNPAQFDYVSRMAAIRTKRDHK